MISIKILIGLCFVMAMATLGSSQKCGTNFPCPFNEEQCSCRNPKGFGCGMISASCDSKSDKMPEFKGTYQEISVVGIPARQAKTIPANHFQTFKQIDTLYLTENGESNLGGVNWDRNAFNGTVIGQLNVRNLDILPAPEALLDAGTTWLSVDAHSPLKLTNDLFKNLPKLSIFQVKNTPVTISPDAFSDLKKEIFGLDFIHSLPESELKNLALAVEPLSGLRQIGFDDSRFNTFDPSIFANHSFRLLDIYFMRAEIENLIYTPTKTFNPEFQLNVNYATIQNVDKSIGEMVTAHAGVKINMYESKLGPCENFDWMRSYLNQFRFSFTQATCVKAGTKISLVQYLKGL